MKSRYLLRSAMAAACVSLAAGSLLAQTAQKPFEPTSGQAGKDVV